MPFVDDSDRVFRENALRQRQREANDPAGILQQQVTSFFGERAKSAETRRKEELEVAKEERKASRAGEAAARKEKSAFISEGVKSRIFSVVGPAKEDQELKEGQFTRFGQVIERGPGPAALARAKIKPEKDVFKQEQAKRFAEAAAEFKTKDRAQLQANVGKIQIAIDLLASGENITGPILGALPGQTVVNPKGVQAQEAVNSAIISTLRPTLGAQFTATEGQQIKELEYNPRLDEKVNERRARRLQKFIQKKIEFSDAFFKFVAARGGSDEGFPFEKFGMEKTGAPAGQAAQPGVPTDETPRQKLERLRQSAAGVR